MQLPASEGNRTAKQQDQAERWCLLLGMTTAAWDGWGRIHVKPHVAACYYFSSAAGILSATAWQLTGMTDFRALYLYVCTLPILGSTVIVALITLTFWRHGPHVVDSKLGIAAGALAGLFHLPTTLLGYLGPIDAVPFHNRFHYVCCGATLNFFASHSMAAGGSKGEHPVQPRTSNVWPFLRASMRALQLIDAYTDLAVIKTFWEQACTSATTLHFDGTFGTHSACS